MECSSSRFLPREKKNFSAFFSFFLVYAGEVLDRDSKDSPAPIVDRKDKQPKVRRDSGRDFSPEKSCLIKLFKVVYFIRFILLLLLLFYYFISCLFLFSLQDVRSLSMDYGIHSLLSKKSEKDLNSSSPPQYLLPRTQPPKGSRSISEILDEKMVRRKERKCERKIERECVYLFIGTEMVRRR